LPISSAGTNSRTGRTGHQSALTVVPLMMCASLRLRPGAPSRPICLRCQRRRPRVPPRVWLSLYSMSHYMRRVEVGDLVPTAHAAVRRGHWRKLSSADQLCVGGASRRSDTTRFLVGASGGREGRSHVWGRGRPTSSRKPPLHRALQSGSWAKDLGTRSARGASTLFSSVAPTVLFYPILGPRLDRLILGCR
jgi:hypothetical protein